MIQLKSPEDITLMKEGGAIASEALRATCAAVSEGVSLRELDSIATRALRERGAEPSFLSVPQYTYATCINVNDGVVHGIPSEYTLRLGDLVKIDLGAYYKGFHTDMATTVSVGEPSSDTTRFLNAGRDALARATACCIEGNYIKSIAAAIQSCVESAGFTVCRDLVGHGVGRELHEEPEVPGYVGTRDDHIRLVEGMVLAIEIIYMKGAADVVVDREDKWTIRTQDGSIAALFEHTVAIGLEEPHVLTLFHG